jgi:TRAP-type C4-dicarboxylate transport system permease small subunit
MGQPHLRSQDPWPVRLALTTARGLARINTALALVCGIALVATVLLVLAEIILRRTAGRGLGGSDEIAGYVMAGVAAWGLAYALTERAHVRIDVATGRLPPGGKVWFDLLSLAAMTAVAGIVSWYGWLVLARTLERGSRANSPLETPLWLPQSVWVSGWVWLTVVSGLLTLAVAILIAARRTSDAAAIGGVAGEVEEAQT